MTNFNPDEISKIYEELDKNADYANDVAAKTVSKYTKNLDDLMSKIYADIVCVEEPSTESIEKYFASLSNCLYFVGENLEKIGIYDDLSKAQAKSKYNSAYMDCVTATTGKKATVAEAQTVAENSSVYENLVNTIYARSYKMFRYKVESAQTMLSTLSKMLSKRMQDAQMPIRDSILTRDSGKQYLIEEAI